MITVKFKNYVGIYLVTSRRNLVAWLSTVNIILRDQNKWVFLDYNFQNNHEVMCATLIHFRFQLELQQCETADGRWWSAKRDKAEKILVDFSAASAESGVEDLCRTNISNNVVRRWAISFYSEHNNLHWRWARSSSHCLRLKKYLEQIWLGFIIFIHTLGAFSLCKHEN